MTVGEKMQIRAGQTVAVLGAPPEIALDLPGDSTRVAKPAGADAVIAFIHTSADLSGAAAKHALDAARADRLAWIAYPKAGQLGTDLNRDRLWQLLEGSGVRPVRQISIDEVWSALRFRPA
jgi:hypothetical protein